MCIAPRRGPLLLICLRKAINIRIRGVALLNTHPRRVCAVIIPRRDQAQATANIVLRREQTIVGTRGQINVEITPHIVPETGVLIGTGATPVAISGAHPLLTKITLISEGAFDSRPFQAGQLQHFYKKWKDLQAPPFILKIIQGYRIPFLTKPPLIAPPQNESYATRSSPEMTAVIRELRDQGALETATTSPSFLSTMFLVEKGDGSQRPIFNLRALNFYVRTESFRLINVVKIQDFLQSRDWLAKIDLSQAYFHIPIVKSHRRFLRLVYQNQLLQMTCLAFGLSSAPKVFASVTNWIAQVLRERGVRILVYLDDFLIAHQNPHTLETHINMATKLLQELGWQINWEKSILNPRTRLEYLGIIWDPWNDEKSLPEKKVLKILSFISNLVHQQGADLKELQSLAGMLNFASFVVPRGRLNFRHIQNRVNQLLYQHPKKRFLLPSETLAEMNWWKTNCRNTSPMQIPPPTHYLTTDASDVAWGGKLNNAHFSGLWTAAEKKLHCNQKELLTILKILQLNQSHDLYDASLLIQSDSRTVVAYLRNEGGTRSDMLMTLTYKIYQFLDMFRIRLRIYHLPGIYNVEADHLSRLKVLPEWHLLPKATSPIFRKWGTPQIDLFASRTAHVVAAYCSLDQTDSQALFCDALSLMWSFKLAWVFPPPCLIPRILHHLNQASGVYLMVVPRWERVFWRADLKSRAMGPPHTIWNLKDVLVDVATGLPPPKVDQMTLEVWRCGGGRGT
ncbi:uncharacterized protein LOC133517488 [Cydia pomonella]|uniref:uncharacterized protein LOC133517488 n=1 Tax=Cydia pomonella TaxID=82600 RepID=UPI002ADE056B|nr:uncharacterized protein LOC133517488 [Cydia pomonella]